jgi:hypothetical protein
MDGTKGAPLGVAVFTPVGTFPGEHDYRRSHEHTRVRTVLEEAAQALNLRNTEDWVARANDREIDPEKTFLEQELKCVVEIEWHKREGGGGS